MIFGKNKKIVAVSVVSDEMIGEGPLSVEKMKVDTLAQYVSRLRKMRPNIVVQSVKRQYRLVTIMYLLSLTFFICGMFITWQKNINVDVVYQRIDGLKIKLPNDPRSRVLLTKVLQDAEVEAPTDKYRLTEKGHE
jgi:hypothetical protein